MKADQRIQREYRQSLGMHVYQVHELHDGMLKECLLGCRNEWMEMDLYIPTEMWGNTMDRVRVWILAWGSHCTMKYGRVRVRVSYEVDLMEQSESERLKTGQLVERGGWTRQNVGCAGGSVIFWI